VIEVLDRTIRVGIVGVAGRMGVELIRAVDKNSSLRLAAAVDRPDSLAIGKDAASLAGLDQKGVRVSAELRAVVRQTDVIVDFSNAETTSANARVCAEARVPLLIGTTGLNVEALASIDAAAKQIPLLQSANTSLALNVLLELVRRAAQAMPAEFDIEIFEAHHRHKVDAPSGTALVLAQAAASGRGVASPDPVLSGSQAGARIPGRIGFSVVRGGDVVGEHEVRFLGLGAQLRPLGWWADSLGFTQWPIFSLKIIMIRKSEPQ
jgi:4-hydroxy-tetrahydrodipicolinate reductase